MTYRLIPAVMSAALLSLAFATSANAALQLSLTGGTTTSVPGAVTIVNFDSPLPAGVTVTGGGINSGSNPGGGGSFGSVSSPTDPMTVQLPSLASYLGFLWGTRDGSNVVSLFNGVTPVGLPITGNTPGTGQGGFANITGNAGEVFDRIVFSFNGCCFEFDNIAVKYEERTGVIPLPAPLLLIGSGLLLLGGLARRRS